MSSRAPPSSLSSSNAVDEAPTVPIQQQQQQQQQQQVPRRPADLNDNDSSATDGDDEDEAAALHNDVVSLRRRMEQVAVREQNREGPPPDMPQVAIHGVGGDLGGVPGLLAPRGPVSAPPPLMPRRLVRKKKKTRAQSAAADGGGGGGGGSASSSSSRTPADLKHWFRAQRRKHMSKMTPAMQERMRLNIARQNREQRKHRLGRKAKKMVCQRTRSIQRDECHRLV